MELKNRGKKYIFGIAGIIICVGVFLFVYFNFFQSETVSKTLPIVAAYTVKADGATNQYSYSGAVVSKNENMLSFQTAGKIINRSVSVGDPVKKGMLLLQIDSKDLQQSAVTVQAQVSTAQTQMLLAKSNLDRFKQLYESGGLSKVQLDGYQATYDAANSAYTMAQSQYKQTLLQLGYTNLYSDCDGIVASVGTDIGQYVAPGQNVVTIAQKSNLEVEIGIPENRLSELQQAKKINVSFWALPGVVIKGAVREISPQADAATHTYITRIKLIDPPSDVELGMTASVNLNTPDGTGDAIFIPLSAVYQNGDTPKVWLVKNNIVHQQAVKLGEFGDNQVQVTSGLKNGEIVVVKGVHELWEGMKVQSITGENQ